MTRQPQSYFLSDSNNPPAAQSAVTRNRRLVAGREAIFPFDAAPPAGGWKREGTLRLQYRSGAPSGELVAKLNGRLLDAVVGGWTIPATGLRDGVNTLALTLKSGGSVELELIEINLP